MDYEQARARALEAYNDADFAFRRAEYLEARNAELGERIHRYIQARHDAEEHLDRILGWTCSITGLAVAGWLLVGVLLVL